MKGIDELAIAALVQVIIKQKDAVPKIQPDPALTQQTLDCE